MRIFSVILLSLIAFNAAAKPRSALVFCGVQMMTVKKRDRLHYFKPRSEVMNRAVQPAYQRSFEFDTVEPVNVLGIDETTDLLNWSTVYTDNPGLWIGVGHHRITIGTMNYNAYYRAWVRNEP